MRFRHGILVMATAGANLACYPATGATGRIVADSGVSLEGAVVVLMINRSDGTPYHSVRSTSDAKGRYRLISGCPHGMVAVLRVRQEGYLDIEEPLVRNKVSKKNFVMKAVVEPTAVPPAPASQSSPEPEPDFKPT